MTDTIKEKLEKIYRYLKSGEPGEKEAAKILLSKLCEKYGLTLEDFEEDRIESRGYSYPRDPYERRIFRQVFGMVINNHDLRYGINRTQSRVFLKMTPIQHAEFKETYDWYIKAFRKRVKESMDIFTSSFIQRNNIYPKADSDDSSQLTAEEIKRLMAIAALADTMPIDTMYKRLK